MPLILCLAHLLTFASLSAQVSEKPDTLHNMTLERKVAQMFMVSFFGSQLTETEAAFLREAQPGAVVLFGRNVESPEQVTALTNSYQQEVMSRGGLPLLIAVDQEGGPIQHLQEGFTRFPAPMLLAATQDGELAYDVGAAMAAEMRAVGVNMNLAPVGDLLTNAFNPIIDRRAFGSDPKMVAPILMNFIRGLQDNGVVATVKHFPGHGDTSEDSHLELPAIHHDRRRLDSLELRPFVGAFEAGVSTVMAAHIWFSAFDAEALPASLSVNVVEGLLREELGYDGIIMTDALDMDAVDTVYDPGEASIRAIEAGNDVIAIGAHVGTGRIGQAISDVVAAVRAGRIALERIDDSVARILRVKQQYGVLDWSPLDPDAASDRLDLSAHDRLVTRLFERGVTALDPQDMIPVQGKVLFVYPGTRPRIRRECDRRVPGHEFVSVSGSPTDGELAWASAAAQEADTVAVFTLNNIDDPRQIQLVEAMPAHKTILVTLWNPIEMFIYPELAAYVQGYSPMSRATKVICEVLHGERRAFGSMPLSFAS
ncbi:MAG: beta-N-acetylhexosaminidase [Chloroflexota bacterium]|nr:beta-N-acetylhexosaminidase [Chloroflexota bacterium]